MKLQLNKETDEAEITHMKRSQRAGDAENPAEGNVANGLPRARGNRREVSETQLTLRAGNVLAFLREDCFYSQLRWYRRFYDLSLF